MFHGAFGRRQMTIREKLWRVQWSMLLFISLIAVIGFVVLYSAAGGNVDPWASRQMIRFAAGIVVLVVVAMVDIRFWFKHAYTFYALALVLLVVVAVAGRIGMGAQRWITFGPLNFQPSELMKVALILALARYFHGGSADDARRPLFLITPLFMILLPAALVMRQPDLGTALMLLMTGGIVFFMAGVRIWKFAAIALLGLAALPVAWHFLREYQKKRILMFLDPESDALGAGYHIIQSKIALGSGGVLGRGFLQGTQGHLSFLPEKQTDFIFTMLAEEFGMIGGLVLLSLYGIVLLYGFAIAFGSRNHFGRLLAMGVTAMFFLYVFINVGMVMGLLPVVGVPLPLVSYGGTAMLSLLFAFGVLMCVHVHRDSLIGRRGDPDDL
ncbi:MAG: rod shape-determining protein RodA [Alphaproteobacteria bacterium]|nr:rod shape-determining protein RodA [Alphaproteobacteria bacterium]